MDESSSKKPHGGDVLPSQEGDETCYLFCEDCAAELRISPQAGLSPAEAGRRLAISTARTSSGSRRASRCCKGSSQCILTDSLNVALQVVDCWNRHNEH